MKRFALLLLLVAPAHADEPDSDAKLVQVMAERRSACDKGDIERCVALGGLADSD